MATGPLQPQDKYVVRFPDGMRDRLKDEAEKNNRSLNAEIIARLDASFAGTPSALVEAARVAESLRINLMDRIAAHDRAISELEVAKQEYYDKREQMAAARRADDEKRTKMHDERLAKLDAVYESRLKKLEEDFSERLNRLKTRLEEADIYAEFCIAREKQFVQTMKSLTGKEPPPVTPGVPRAVRRGRGQQAPK